MRDVDIFSPFQQNEIPVEIFSRELKPDESGIASQRENFETCSYFWMPIVWTFSSDIYKYRVIKGESRISWDRV